jgi:ATP-binding cassette subfamily F protein 3
MIKLILGQLEPTGGRIEAGYNVQVGYYDQENQNLTEENTVLEELWSAYPHEPEVKIRSTLAQFRFVGEDVEKAVSVLSGGERARLTLAKLILSHMNLLILDEPTNHLDIDSREALESALEAFDGTIFVGSHDRYLTEKLATRILQLKPGRAFAGDLLDYRVDHTGHAFSEFEAYKNARIAEFEEKELASPSVSVQSSNKEQYLKNKQATADARKRKNYLDKLRRECESIEGELAAIEEELFGSAAADYVRAAELDERKNALEERLMEIYEELETSE